MKKPTIATKNARKLALTRESLRLLTKMEMDSVEGGLPPRQNTEDCDSVFHCGITWTCMSG